MNATPAYKRMPRLRISGIITPIASWQDGYIRCASRYASERACIGTRAFVVVHLFFKHLGGFSAVKATLNDLTLTDYKFRITGSSLSLLSSLR